MVAKKRKQRDSATNGKQINATDSMLPLTTTTTSTKTAKKNQNPVKSKSSQKTNIVSNFTVSSSGKKFLMPQDGAEFDKLLKEKYQGFVHIPASQLTPRDFHQRSRAALERLRDANYYQYDVIMAGGKHSSRTFVKRTLVGDPGITYKYLGLRLFAHAWSGPGVVPPVLKEIGDMNQRMMEMTKHQGGKYSDYNLTLINYMEPSSHTKIGFKDEPQYGMGKISVSWHADSSLEPYSDIGVYHCLPTQKATKWDWKIALRPYPDGEDKDVLPIVATTKDGDAYFLMGSFNHTHQHSVLAGTQANRISSTHRVAVTAEDTYQYISKRVKRALKHFRKEMEKSPLQWDAEVLVDCQHALTEVEMEWIAQYWLQGDQHNTMHVWWQKPMKSLETLWSTLEQLTYQVYQTCLTATPSTVPRAVVKGLLNELTARHRLREQWDERRADKIYQRRITPPFRPVAHPVFTDNVSDQLPGDLTSATRELSGILSRYGAAPKDEDDSQPEDRPRQAQSPNTKAGKGSKRPAGSRVGVEEGLPKKRGPEVDAPGGKKKKTKRRKGDANGNSSQGNGDSNSKEAEEIPNEKEAQKTTPPDGEQNDHVSSDLVLAEPQMSKSKKRKLRRKAKPGDKSSLE